MSEILEDIVVDISKMETTTPTSEKSSAVGNAAAMREALEAAIPIMRACLFDYYNTTDVNKVVGEMKAVLSAPPRNCDRFGGDLKMLQTAWFDWTGSPSGQNPDGTVKLTFAEWLLEIAEVHHD